MSARAFCPCPIPAADLLKRALRELGLRLLSEDDSTPSSCPEVGSIWWFVGELESDHLPYLVLEESNRQSTWEPNLARRLSALTGGFCVSGWNERTLSRGGHFVFFAGRTIDAWTDDMDRPERQALALGAPPISYSKEAYNLVVEYFWAVTQPRIASVQNIANGPEHIWRFAGPAPLDQWRLDVSDERPLTRIGVCEVARASLDAAVPRLRKMGFGGRGWRWLHQPAIPDEIFGPGHSLAFFEREGQPDGALMRALSELLGRDVLQIGLPGKGAPFTWGLSTADGKVSQGTEVGTIRLIEQWERLLKKISQPVLSVFWPADQPGEQL
ncbi:MAG TPA: hypothetical protein VKZ18_19185 [Polyangia bacterium]|nr:hypothetical protein [Polyangia bacterium]